MSNCCSGFMSINICMSSCIATFQSCAIACILRRFRIKGKCSSVEAIVTQARETVLQPQTAIPHGTREALCSKTVFFVCYNAFSLQLQSGKAGQSQQHSGFPARSLAQSFRHHWLKSPIARTHHNILDLKSPRANPGQVLLFFFEHFLPHRAPAVVSCAFWLPHFLKVARARSDKHILEQHGTLAFTTAWFC